MGTENEGVLQYTQELWDTIVAEHSDTTREIQANLESYRENGEWGWFLDIALNATSEVYDESDINEMEAGAAVRQTAAYIVDTAKAYEAFVKEQVDLSEAPEGMLTIPLRTVFEYIQATGPLFGIFLTHVTRPKGTDGVAVVMENAEGPLEAPAMSPGLAELLGAAAAAESGEITDEEFDAAINAILDKILTDGIEVTEEEIG